MESTQSKIEKIVREAKTGSVYFPSDFFECGSEKAVSKALQRLVESQVLLRMERGIYCKPGYDTKWGMGLLSASAEAVAEAIARRDGIRLGPSIGTAMNKLGLSEQVVVNPVFTTDGPSRSISIKKGRRPLVFQHVSPRVFYYKSKVVMMTVIALTNIKKEYLWEYDMESLGLLYKRIPYEEIREDLKITPKWIRELILEMYGN